MRFIALVYADMYRDGGSLEAVFRVPNGRFDGVCLTANILSFDGIGKRYSDAYWFKDETNQHRSFRNTLTDDALVLPESSAEALLLSELEAFLAVPVLEPEIPPSVGDNRRLDIVRKLAVELPNREHFDPKMHEAKIRAWEARLASRKRKA